MNVLITGSSGFVGSHLTELLDRTGHQIVGIGHQEFTPTAGSYETVDMLNAEAVQKLDLGGVDAVVHLAGLAAVGPSFDQPRRYIDANAGMQINLFEALLSQNNTPRILVISTGGLYRANHLPIVETAEIDTPNPYAVSKMTQEHLSHYYAKRGFEVMVARPFNHIGPGQTEGFLASDLAKQIAELEASGGGTIQVGDLSSKRDFTDVRDIVRAYLLLLEKGRAGETYNVCSGHSHSGQTILEGLLQHSSCKIKLETDQARLRPSDIPDIYGSCAKLHTDTGWKPEIPLDQTLADVLTDWRQRVAKTQA
jgi:GDP-4-dehydro-6-deoxy-D-mannose reductase